MHTRIRLPGGTLKIKDERYLRASERDGAFPMSRIGGLYFIWVANRARQPGFGDPAPPDAAEPWDHSLPWTPKSTTKGQHR